jgi:hypothetical protein
MDWDRVRELLLLDRELGTFELLRARIPAAEFYKVDRWAWLVAAIEGIVESGEGTVMSLFIENE